MIVDSDWKKQAQEEKKRLAEQEQQRKATEPAAGTPAAPGAAASPAGPAAGQPRGKRAGREMPPAGFPTLVQSLMTQALIYLGEVAVRGAEPMVDLDMAKHNIDLLGVLEEKTQNNLTPEEKHLLELALYEVRMRFIGVAQQVANHPA